MKQSKQKQNDQISWLLNRIDESVNYIAKKRLFFQYRASIIKIAMIFLSASITICLGLRLPQYDSELRMAAFIMGGIVTLLNAVEPFFNYRSLWIEHEEAKYKLHRLKDQIEFDLSDELQNEIKKEQVLEYQKDYHEIWDSLSNKWLQYRRLSQSK